jgi:hypothetical protein
VREENLPAQLLYKKNGFVAVEIVRKHYRSAGRLRDAQEPVGDAPSCSLGVSGEDAGIPEPGLQRRRWSRRARCAGGDSPSAAGREAIERAACCSQRAASSAFFVAKAVLLLKLIPGASLFRGDPARLAYVAGACP